MKFTMTVRQLTQELQELPDNCQDWRIVLCNENGHVFTILGVTEVDEYNQLVVLGPDDSDKVEEIGEDDDQ